MRAEQLLPDHVDQVTINGTAVRKGTVAAFLANARVWTDRASTEAAPAAAAADICAPLACSMYSRFAMSDCANGST
jgi:hypothetical protein